MSLSTNIFNTPEGCYEAIPTDLAENIDFRRTLHSVLEKDTGLQQVFMQLMFAEPKIFFNAVAWTADPRKPKGQRNWPFILRRPRQEQVVDTLNYCIENQVDMAINKSRDEGATELVCKTFALKALIPDSYFIVGSRNKELVDSMGDPFTLFAKIDYAFDTMPPWMKVLVQYNPQVDRKDMQLSLTGVGSVIRGETTNESFSAGRRSTAMFLDEFGRVEPRVAKAIKGSVMDVSGCIVYGSTHWYGDQHPFNQVLKNSSVKVVNLLWYDNPVKNYGLYKTPDYDVIEIVDREYYLRNYPEIFRGRTEWTFKLSDLEKDLIARGYTGPSPRFIADKCETLPPGCDLRSPWHDAEYERRSGDVRDITSNIWGSPIGAQDSVFSSITLNRIESQTICPPKNIGDIYFDRNDGKIENVKYLPGGRQRLRWWGELDNGKPDRTHNYVVGCDIALGTGSSNSVAAVLDVHTNEVVGVWACPRTSVELFADTVMALSTWLGDAYVVFENNGGHGVNFGRRLNRDGCRRMYTQRKEDAKLGTYQNKWGWSSNPTSKADLLSELGIALSEGLKTERAYTSCVVHDQDVLDELRGYVYYENGDLGTSSEQDLTTGARQRHGDRVIAVGLCVLGSKYQHQRPKDHETKIKQNTFAWRKKQVEKEQERNRRTMRTFRF